MANIINRTKKLIRHFELVGIDEEGRKKIYAYSIIFSVIVVLSVNILYHMSFYKDGYPISYYIGLYMLWWSFGLLGVLLIVYLGIFFYLDIRKNARTREIEKYLPEYLTLTSANIRAGMLIDQALWYAIRPKFGILAKEMENISKEVIGGRDLKESLIKMSSKYNSPTLTRTIQLIIKGLESGGKMAEILNNIAENLADLEMEKKDMAASVTTYAIFITFAAIVASPALMALAGQLLKVIKGLMFTLSNSGVKGNSLIHVSPPVLTQDQFVLFSVIMLFVTSFFSSLIVASIKRGKIMDGLKYIPLFIIIGIIIFLVSNSLLSGIFSSMI